jgi:uncharacterized repeat protein (TIGR01451 family)
MTITKAHAKRKDLDFGYTMLNLIDLHQRRQLLTLAVVVLHGLSKCLGSLLRLMVSLRVKVGVLAALVMAFNYATAQVCYNPALSSNPNITTSGVCSNLARNNAGVVMAPGFQLGKYSGDGTESCTLNFTSPVKGLKVDIGVQGCDRDINQQCEKAVFTLNGAHRPIASGELTTPTSYSSVDPANYGPEATTVTLDGNGDVVGSSDFWVNGDGQIKFPEGVVRSITITHVDDLTLPNPGGGWYNVCYDGLASPTVTVSKISKGATGEFKFKGTANGNGFSTDGSYGVTTGAPGVATSGSSVPLSTTNVLTEIQEVVPSGWVLNSATCVDANAAGSGNIKSTFGVLVGSTLQIPASTVLSGANLQCTFTNTYVGQFLSGKVILDTGAGTGTANDGIQNGAEHGHSGVSLSLTDCGTTVYSSGSSAADGSFSLSVDGAPPGQQVCLVESLPAGYSAVSVNAGSTGGSYNASTTTLKFTASSSTGYSGIVLGNVPVSTFTSDGAQLTAAGQLVTYAHTYVAGTAGSVVFSTSDSPTPTGLLWSSTLYLDANCNAALDSADTLLTAAVNVTAGQQVCILNRVMAPAGAQNGAQDLTTVNATQTWAVPTLTPTSQAHVLKNVDTTTVGVAGLTLLKEVRTTASCPTDAASSIGNSAAYASSSTAKPGDTLEYRLRYINSTAAPLTAVVVHDQVPAYTQFVSALCLTTPTVGVAGCAVSQQPAVNASSGAIVWTLSDASVAPVGVQPLASGAVSFCIQVQQ